MDKDLLLDGPPILKSFPYSSRPKMDGTVEAPTECRSREVPRFT